MTPQDGQTWGPLIGIGIAAVFMIIRMSGSKARPLSAATMMVVPALLLAGFVALAVTAPVPPVGYLWVFLAFVAGGAFGWQRGRMMPIHVDPDTGKPMVKPSPAALIFILALMAARIGLRQVMSSEAATWHIDPNVVTDAFMAFAVGLLGVSRLEMLLRARRLVSDHQSAGKIVA